MLDPSQRTHPRVRGTTQELNQRARELRADMTPAERRLWTALRDRQLAGLKFRRQHAIGTFILDFYCASCRLNVEVDGDIHDVPEQAEHDAVRDEYLRSCGYRVLRVTNDQVFDELPGVLRRILGAAGVKQ